MPLELDVETETMRLLNSPWNAKKATFKVLGVPFDPGL